MPFKTFAYPFKTCTFNLFCILSSLPSIANGKDYDLFCNKSMGVLYGKHIYHCYAPNFEKVGDILVSACPYVCMYVCMYVCTYVCFHVRDIVLKLHVWIPHGKIADAYFWFSLNYLPLSNYGPLTNKGMKFCKCCISKSIIARNLKLVSADRG